MHQTKVSSKIYSMAKSAVAAAVLPVFLIYIMIGKPDYKLMNGLAHIVLPVAGWVGDVVSWPVRATGDAITSLRELSNTRSENEELRARITAAEARRIEYEVAILENQRLRKQLDMAADLPQKSIAARIVQNNTAFHHNTFFINKGAKHGVGVGMAAVSFSGALVGIITDVGADFARVRGLSDTKSNIPVRIAGSEVYGFLRGTGGATPALGFFSDPEFQSIEGLRLITSGIKGILPDGIYVGETTDETDVAITDAGKIVEVMILKFDGKEKYK